MIAVLYTRPDGPYASMPGVDAWTEARDATGYPGPWPVVAHPPCGPWGRWAWRCLQDPTLGPIGVDQVRRWGGVLEHPATSRLWPTCGLPEPGALLRDAWGGWSMQIEQSRWGHRAPKATRLYFVGIEPHELLALPPRVRDPGGRIVLMCEREREETPIAFALWLVEVVRRVRARVAA